MRRKTMNSDTATSPEIQSADALKEEGLAQFQRGDRDEALSVFEKAAEAYSQDGDSAGESEMFNNMGVIYRLNRDWPAAIDALNRAEAGFQEAGENKRRAQVLANTGDLSASMRDYEKAAGYYSQASELLASESEGDLQGQVLRAFSLMRMRQRRWIEAIDLMALSIDVRDHPSFAQKLLYHLMQFARRLLGTR
jgi:tetratricopeptide (TPR) repeat protein